MKNLRLPSVLLGTAISIALFVGSSTPSAALPMDFPDPQNEVGADSSPDSLVRVDISGVPASRANELSRSIPGHDEEINAGTQQLVLSADEARLLAADGYEVNILGPAEQPGPGWPRCYSPIDNVYEQLAGYASATPSMVELVDIGDSYCKTQGGCVTPGGDTFDGRDIFVLRLTNEHATSPKEGRLWIDGGLHARELPTVELMLAMFEHLLRGYGRDPQVTYLLDHREIHIGVVMNPDGRTLVEMGTLDETRGTPWYWRKNANPIRSDKCKWPPGLLEHYGVDLNRNHAYKWDSPGHSKNPCAETYNGTAPASEPEARAYESYISSIFADRRGPDPEDAAPLTTSGIMINYHNATIPGKVLVPWGWSQSDTANHDDLEAIASRYVSSNEYDVQHALYTTSGSTRDWGYGELGIAAYVIELEGAGFFTPCSLVPEVVGHHIEPIKMALALADRPYERIRGPEVIAVAAADQIASGEVLDVSAVLDESRSGGDAISAAEVTIGRPGGPTAGDPLPHPGVPPGTGLAMASQDGSFDTQSESAVAAIDTRGMTTGLHYVAVRARDEHGHWGAIAARFVTVTEPIPQLTISAAAPAEVTAGDALTYTLTVTASYNTAPGVVVTDRFAPALSFESASDGGAVQDGTVEWSLGDMRAGESKNLLLTVRTGTVYVPIPIVNSEYEARFTGGPVSTGPPVSTRIIPLPKLSVAKIGPELIVGGELLEYVLEVLVRDGPADEVVVTDQVPAGTSFVAASHDGTNVDGTVTWSLGRMEADTTVRLLLAVQVTPTPVDEWVVNADYAANHSRGAGERGPPVVTQVRATTKLYVPRAER